MSPGCWLQCLNAMRETSKHHDISWRCTTVTLPNDMSWSCTTLTLPRLCMCICAYSTCTSGGLCVSVRRWHPSDTSMQPKDRQTANVGVCQWAGSNIPTCAWVPTAYAQLMMNVCGWAGSNIPACAWVHVAYAQMVMYVCEWAGSSIPAWGWDPARRTGSWHSCSAWQSTAGWGTVQRRSSQWPATSAAAPKHLVALV